MLDSDLIHLNEPEKEPENDRSEEHRWTSYLNMTSVADSLQDLSISITARKVFSNFMSELFSSTCDKKMRNEMTNIIYLLNCFLKLYLMYITT